MAIIGLRKPREQKVAAVPAIGDALPAASRLRSGRPYRCVVFLRHVGCPFAEKTVRALRDLPSHDGRVDVFFVSHGDADTAARWLRTIGGPGTAKWIDDPSRESYGACGLGYSALAHFLGLESLRGAVALRRDGIVNRTASGTRWQRAGAFLVDGDGRVRWKHVPATANRTPEARDVVAALDEAEGVRP